MAPHRPHLRSSLAGFPAIVPFALGDNNVSVGVVGLVVAILLLVAVLLALVFVEVAGEHRANVENRHHHG